MPDNWLQIKGDPSVRAFLFDQQRAESLFDAHLDRVLQVMHTLLTVKGVFHVKTHFSSSQMTCWFYDDPYNYRVFVREEAIAPDFLAALPDRDFEHHPPMVSTLLVGPILGEFKRLRLTDRQVYLRNASINRINGMVGMTFSCDGSHYIGVDDFLRRLDCFGKEA